MCSSTRLVATAICDTGLSQPFLDAWQTLLTAHSITVTSTKILSPSQAADYYLGLERPIVNLTAFRDELFVLGQAHRTDVICQDDNIFRRHKRLFIFDMDSTLIRQEVIDEIARHAGVMKDVAKITVAAMNGEIDFTESLKRRVALLQGCSSSVLHRVRSDLVFTEGAHELCRALKKLGCKMAVISGGFMPVAIRVKAELGLDYMYANQLATTPDGKTLTGVTVGPIVDGFRKAELLDVIAQAEHVGKDQIIAVGDGANDLWMLAEAGIGIAFNAKPTVQKRAQARINQKSLTSILYVLGLTDEDIALLLAT
ncbi:phosphoserine phosphatase [Synchytrium endobioticum]|uniref:phosphoserine phosphatase n=1 Tax=Synchytrium endobioticum TaxID=286115 RepID=A0A507DL80_9FUNG|nr:phosphoserine phosphatase [Synchytrium endobioticum]TPX54851.1 phosphoserine phosphatase [Synchytrium endobioticum]